VPGFGLNLVTDFESDAFGRRTSELGPEHTIDLEGTATLIRRAQWVAYLLNGFGQELRAGQGYLQLSDSTETLINPVAIRKQTPQGRPLQDIQALQGWPHGSSGGSFASLLEDVPVSVPGPVSSDENEFPQESYVRWTTHQYANCCQLVSTRRYHTIPASGAGTSGTNYDQTSFDYDTMGRRNRTQSAGDTIMFTVFDARSQPEETWVGTNDDGATEADPSGGGFDPDNNMVIVTAYEYDNGVAGGDGNLTKHTQYVDDTDTRVTSYGYDWRNREMVLDGEVDFYKVSFYDNLDRVVKVDRHDTDGEGNLIARNETLYDDRGRVYRTIRYAVDLATGSVTGSQSQNRFYDPVGNILRQEPAEKMGYQEFEYDSLGRRTSETDPLDHSRLFAYDDASNVISLTDQNEEVWARGYDALGRLVRSANPLDESITYGFNNAGHRTTTTNALNETTTSMFDDAGRLIATSDPLNKVTSYAYDANGNQTSVTDPNNLTTESEYDYLNRLVKVTAPAGHETKYEYNLVGELLVETDPKNHSTTHQYDALGRKISTTDRLNHTTRFAWNILGLQESMTDAENQTTSYVYDGYGRLYQTIWPDAELTWDTLAADQWSDLMADEWSGLPATSGFEGITQTEYDDLNRVFRTTDQLGDTVTFVYDDAGRLLSRDYRTAANSPNGPITDSDTFTYDNVGRTLTAEKERYSNTVTKTYDEAGRVITESLTIDGETYTVEIGYDAAGRQSVIIYPDGTVVERSYTARGELEEIEYEGNPIDSRTYDDGGRLTSETLGNGLVVNRTYHANSNLLASITNAAVGNYSYSWDANHNKLTETITGPMAGYGFTVPNGGYDDENRLIEWNRDDSNLDQEWDLSPVGDWNGFTQNTIVQTRIHGPVHELVEIDTTPLTYDPKGNLTGDDTGRTCAWDADNMLVSTTASSVAISYAYDALGRRVARTAGDQATVYVSCAQIVLAEYEAAEPAANPLRKYVNASYVDEPVLLIDRTVLGAVGAGTDELLYYHRNQQYSITALTDNSGAVVERYSYAAYGQPTIWNAAASSARSASDYGNSYLHTARAYDSDAGLQYLRSRYISPTIGRFISRDSIAYWGGINLYAIYFAISGVDPTGTDAQICSDGSHVTFRFAALPGDICPGAIGNPMMVTIDFGPGGGRGGWTIGGAVDSARGIPGVIGVSVGPLGKDGKLPPSDKCRHFEGDQSNVANLVSWLKGTMSGDLCEAAFSCSETGKKASVAGTGEYTDYGITPGKKACVEFAMDAACIYTGGDQFINTTLFPDDVLVVPVSPPGDPRFEFPSGILDYL